MYASSLLLGLATPRAPWYNVTPLYYIVMLVKWRDNESEAKVVIGLCSRVAYERRRCCCDAAYSSANMEKERPSWWLDVSIFGLWLDETCRDGTRQRATCVVILPAVGGSDRTVHPRRLWLSRWFATACLAAFLEEGCYSGNCPTPWAHWPWFLDSEEE